MTNWDAVKTGSLDALMAAIMERMSDQRDDPSSREQEYADTSLSLIERCKAAERALAESEARRAEAERERDDTHRNCADANDIARMTGDRDAALARAQAAERSLAAAVEVLRPFVDALDGLMFHRAEDGTTTVTGKAVDDFDAWRGFVDALIKVRALAAALAGGSHG